MKSGLQRASGVQPEGTDRPWADPDRAGRLEVNGEEWWACDPYPTWYRWEGDRLLWPMTPQWPT